MVDRGIVERICSACRRRRHTIDCLGACTETGPVAQTLDATADDNKRASGYFPDHGVVSKFARRRSRNVPTNYATEWLRLLQSTFYVVTIHTQWQLPSLSPERRPHAIQGQRARSCLH